MGLKDEWGWGSIAVISKTAASLPRGSGEQQGEE